MKRALLVLLFLVPWFFAGMLYSVAQELQRYDIVAYPADNGEYVKFEDVTKPGKETTFWVRMQDEEPTEFPVVIYRKGAYFYYYDEEDYNRAGKRTRSNWIMWSAPPAEGAPDWECNWRENPPATWGNYGQELIWSVWVQRGDRLQIPTTINEVSWTTVDCYANMPDPRRVK